VQLVEVALAPIGGGKAKPGDKSEQQHKNSERHPINVLHGIPPRFIFLS
jgi:hypothetical protein